MFPAGAAVDNPEQNSQSSTSRTSGPLKPVQTKRKGSHIEIHKSLRSTSEPPTKKQLLDSSKAIFLEDLPGLVLDDAYKVDRSSNRGIYTFGSIFEKHVAKFRPKPRNTPILGYQSLCLGDLFDNTNTETSHKKVPKSRYFSKHSRTLLAKSTLRIPSGPIEPSSSDQILLNFETPLLNSTKTVQPKDTSPSVLSLCESLNRRVYDKPSDLRAWVELIDLQAKEAAFLHFNEPCPTDSDSSSCQRSITSTDRLVILKKQLSIAERALTSNPGCLQLKILTIRIGELAAELQSHGAMANAADVELYQPERIGRNWAQLVFTYPQLVTVWRGYLAHLMGKYASPALATQTIGSGLFARIDGVFKRALSTLSGIISGRILSHRPQPDTAEQAIDFFADYCHWLVQAGHAERALALWQAMVEFNCFRPAELEQTPTDQCMLEMELFWSSGVARFGQPGSEHWSCWYRAHRRGSRARAQLNTTTPAPPVRTKKSNSSLYPVEEILSDATKEQLQSKWIDISERLQSIATQCEDVLIQSSSETPPTADDAPSRHTDTHDTAVVPTVLSSTVQPDQWLRRGPAPSLTGGHGTSTGQSRAVLHRRGKAWVGLERARELVGWLPSDAVIVPTRTGQTLTGDLDPEDPERLVLFDDIKPCLLELRGPELAVKQQSGQATAVVALQQRLLLQCLEFLGAYEASVAMQYQLPADLRIIHDLAHIGPLQRHNLSPSNNTGAIDSVGLRDKFAHLTGQNQEIWVKARRCFLDAAISQVRTMPSWPESARTWWTSTLSRLRFQVNLDRLLDGIQWHNLTCKTVITTWRHCGRLIMSLAANQQNLELWHAYASGFWQAAMLMSTSQPADSTAGHLLIMEARKVLDTAINTHPVPAGTQSPPADVIQPELVEFYASKLAPRLKLIQQYIDLELGVSPGVGGLKLQVDLGSESRVLQILVHAANGGATYTAPDTSANSSHDPLGPSTVVRTSHAFGKRIESVWRTLVSLPEDSRLNQTEHGPLVDSLTALTPVLAYLSLMFDLLTVDQSSLASSITSLASLLHRIDRLRQSLASTPTSTRWSEAPKSPTSVTAHIHRVCYRQFIALACGGLSAFSAHRQRNRRPLLQDLLKTCTDEEDEERASQSTTSLDWLYPSQMSYLLPPRVALDKRLLSLSLDNASSYHGLLPPLFLTQLFGQINRFTRFVSQLAAEVTCDQTVLGFRLGGAVPSGGVDARGTGPLDPIESNLSMLLPPHQLDAYAGCLPVALDLVVLSVELERWTSLLAGSSADRQTHNPAQSTDRCMNQRVRNAFERAVHAGPFIAPLVMREATTGQQQSASLLHHIMLGASTPSFWAAHLRLVIWRAYMAFGWMSGSGGTSGSSTGSTATLHATPNTATSSASTPTVDPRQRRQAVKAIFYRAVEDLPWAKNLYTDLVRYCPEDVEEMVDLLSERELRVRTPLEEVDLLLTARPM